MSDLSNGLKIPNDSIREDDRRPKPAVMLITITLLIAALLLTGAMLLYYTGAQKQGLAASEEGQPETSGFATWFKTLASDSTESTEQQEDSGGFSLFGKDDGQVRWPKLKLTGYGTRPDGSGGFAIINGQQYQIGHKVNGKVTIVDVREHDVLVEYAGETNSLIVDVNR